MIAPALGLAPNVTVPASHLANGVVLDTIGVGLTVTVNVPAAPTQLFAVGVTENVPATGELVVFANVTLVISPLPLAPIPIDV